jgi:D-alanyl-D-alanine carboxypeptidase/D-alanyl-D-alanine-endopeptidase (penicillin-binding protein 4)
MPGTHHPDLPSGRDLPLTADELRMTGTMKPLRRAPFVVLLAAVLALGAGQATPASAATPSQQAADLRAKVQRALAGSTARSVAVAVDVDGVGEVDRRGATASLPPASTAKLFTTFAALQRLGVDYRERTQLRAVGAQVGTHLRGDLYLVAAGDPYFTAAHLNVLARTIADAGIRSIDGHLVVDDTRYDRVRRGAGWKTEWVPEESGPLSAMALDRNTWRRDSAYLGDPATPVLGKLRSYLASKGISVSASLRRGPVPSRARVLASHVSAPLSTVVRRISKDSDNFASELLLKELGSVGRKRGTGVDGALVLEQVLSGLGVTVGTVADGSGLSPRNRQTAAGEMSLLRAAETTGAYSPLRASLPVACKDGTLKKRFCGTAAAGRAVAKTGTLDTARTLTGWTTTADGHRVRFAFLLASFSSGTKAREAIDRAVVVLASARLQA